MWSIDHSQDLVTDILKLGKNRSGKDTIYTRAATNLAVAQLPATALYMVIYALSFTQLPGITTPVNLQVGKGMIETLGSGPFSKDEVEVRRTLWGILYTSLSQELISARENALESSPTADAVFETIFRGLSDLEIYKTSPKLAIPEADRVAITHAIDARINATFEAFAKMEFKIVTG